MIKGSFRVPGAEVDGSLWSQLHRGPSYSNVELRWNCTVTEAFGDDGEFLGTVVFVPGIIASEAIKGGLKK
jgi:hypothetical protein